MIDTGRDGHKVIAALRERKIYIGRIWPVWPNAVRVTVGSPEDMQKFRVAFKDTMDTSAMAWAPGARVQPRELAGMGGTTFLS